MSYNKSKLQKEFKKVDNSSQRKNSLVVNVEKIPFSSNNQAVWIPGKSNTPTHNNTYSHKYRKIDGSPTTSTLYTESTDNFNHNSLLQKNKTYTVVNVTFDEISQRKVANEYIVSKKVVVADRPQNKINRKKNNCYLNKLKDNNDDCSTALRNEQDVIFKTYQHTEFLESLDNCPLMDCVSEDVIQKKPIIHEENGEKFDIVFLNKQQQLETKTINI